ncbi:MAG: TetR/AcrR family transcriptional regulator [Lysobacterales bacterium]
MGRQSTLNHTEIFATVSRQLNTVGSVTVRDIVGETGVSVGSLFHRFGSREGLLAEAWLDALVAFQTVFLGALDGASHDAGLQAALATPRFCRREPDRAALLACCRASEFLSSKTPKPISKSIKNANRAVEKAVRGFSHQQTLSIQCCRLALAAIPLGAVRIYLPGQPVPKSVDRYIEAAYKAVTAADSVDKG